MYSINVIIDRGSEQNFNKKYLFDDNENDFVIYLPCPISYVNTSSSSPMSDFLPSFIEIPKMLGLKKYDITNVLCFKTEFELEEPMPDNILDEHIELCFLDKNNIEVGGDINIELAREHIYISASNYSSLYGISCDIINLITSSYLFNKLT